jgi:hypothetical protein
MAGQVIYHLLAAAHATRAPWPVVVLVSCMPVLTLGFGAALTHLLRSVQPAADAAVIIPEGVAPDVSPAIAADVSPAITADAAAVRTQDATAAMPRTRPRSPRRTGRPDTATAVARLCDRHPDMTTADMARRLGVSARTVRRHLAARTRPSSIAA